MAGSSSHPVENEKKQESYVLMLRNLSNDLIAAVLSYIPTEVAVDTFMLYQECRDLWTLGTVVDLDQTPTRSWLRKQEPYLKHVNDLEALQTRRRCKLDYFRKKKISTIMERYMQLHEDCMTRLKLKLTTDEAFDSLLSQWLKFAVEKNVKELDLDLRMPKWEYPVDQYCLPADIFSCTVPSLQALTLRGCTVDRSFSIHGLCNLKKVVLDEVELSIDMVQALLLQSEFLTLKKLVVKGGTMSSRDQTAIVNENMKGLKIVNECYQDLWLEGCEIYAPNIESFKYKGETVNFSLRSAPPNLKRATIIVNKCLGVNNAFRRLINQVCFVEHLTSGFSSNFTDIHPVAGGEQEGAIPLKPFLYLKKLEVITGGVDAHEKIANILIKNAPQLEKYNICPEFMIPEEKRERQMEQFLLSEFMI